MHQRLWEHPQRKPTLADILHAKTALAYVFVSKKMEETKSQGAAKKKETHSPGPSGPRAIRKESFMKGAKAPPAAYGKLWFCGSFQASGTPFLVDLKIETKRRPTNFELPSF